MAGPDTPRGTNSGGAGLPTLRELRFGVRSCALGLLLAYALVVPLKWNGLMPDRLTWLDMLLGPAVMFGVIGSMFAGHLWLKQRWWILFVPVAVLAWAVMIGLLIARQGW